MYRPFSRPRLPTFRLAAIRFAYFREIQRILTPGDLMIHMPVHPVAVNKHLQGLFNVLMSIENRFDDADAGCGDS